MVGLGNNRVFSVKSFYEKLLIREEVVFSSRSIWTPQVPRKVHPFSLLAGRVVILAVENLRMRKIVCISWCYMCKETDEDVNHLLLHCKCTMIYSEVCLGGLELHGKCQKL